jgi:hypothetical protein
MKLSSDDLHSMRLKAIFSPEDRKASIDWHFEEIMKYVKRGELRYCFQMEGPKCGPGVVPGLREKFDKTVSFEQVTDVSGKNWIIIKW